MRFRTAVKAVRYRVGQFLRALTAERAISEQRLAKAWEVLSPEELALFAQQAPQDQRHALAVWETLVEGGFSDRDLLTAALLHDVGKAAIAAPPWRRGLYVLAKRFAPWALGHQSHDGAGREDGPLGLYANHAEIGARWAEKAGCSTRTVHLIRHHEHPSDTSCSERDPLLRALQVADGMN